jgi:hypothetical protein|tara:strand:- start:490 stop:678 length:189 start_codon:yes stop_codon:yes gene_type:complete
MITFEPMWDFIQENFFAIFSAALIFADVVVSLTPTKADDRALGYIRAIFGALFGTGKRKQKK